MSSDSHPEHRNPKRSSPDDAGEDVPEDPGKTWVPDDRDGPFLAETEAMPDLPADTDIGALSSLGSVSENSRPTEMLGDTQSEDPPRQFGEYELIERVGGGGMGNVYKAHHLRLDRIVALKTLRAGTAKSELQLERFHREAKAAARLDHPNIVPCYEFGKFNGWNYLTMAFVAGESLQTRLARGPLATEEAARLALDLAKAVAHAHHQGVIHRDIKPGNVILGEDGRPRLTDFGIAKLTSPITSPTPIPPMQLTQVGQALGTPGYMAPEQSAGRRWEVGPSADIYGVGGVLVAALTGHHPGSDDSFESLAQTIPGNLQTICDRCLAYRPQDRFASADQLVDALEKLLAGETPEPPTKPEPPSEAAQVIIKLPKAGLWKILGAVAAVLVSALLLGIWLGGGWKNSPPGDISGHSQESNLNSQAAADLPSPQIPLQCRLEVFVGDGIESYFPVEAPNSLPLRPEDQLFADAKVSRLQNAFLYVLRIDTLGKAALEKEGNPVGLLPAESPDTDSQRPPFEVKASFHDYLEIPREGPAGMLTLVLLARSKPLSETETAEIAKALKSLPAMPQPAPGASTFQRFSFRNSRASETRDPLGDQHPVKLILREVLKQLGPYFEQMEAVSFAVPAQP